MSDDLNGVMRGVMVVMFLGVGLVICARTDERAKICLQTQSIASFTYLRGLVMEHGPANSRARDILDTS